MRRKIQVINERENMNVRATKRARWKYETKMQAHRNKVEGDLDRMSKKLSTHEKRIKEKCSSNVRHNNTNQNL